MRQDFSNEKPKESYQKIQGFVNSRFAVIRKATKSMERNKRICIRKEANRSNMEYHQAGGTEIGEGNKGTNFEKYTFFFSKTLAYT